MGFFAEECAEERQRIYWRNPVLDSIILVVVVGT